LVEQTSEVIYLFYFSTFSHQENGKNEGNAKKTENLVEIKFF